MKRSIQLWLACEIAVYTLATTSPTRAQIVPDATLPVNSSVTPQGNTSIITGGTAAGSNLFHSFEQFSVPTGNTAYFNNASDIQNIISRVTGSSPSDIDGVLQANGTANLFLLNPNGIIFDRNASLNIGGSFFASTASGLNFADGTQFSATAHSTTPLLSVSVPIGLQFGETAGGIRVQGLGNNLSVDPTNSAFVRGENPGGLQVKPGKTLALVGNGVTLAAGNLIAEEGRIEVGSVAGSGLVSLTPTDKGLTLGYSGVPNLQDIHLSRRASVDASGSGGGEIQVQGKDVILTEGSAIFALTEGSKPGGTVSVNASDSVQVIGTSADGLFPSAVFTDTEGAGAAGGLTITTGQLLVRDGAVVTSDTLGTGNAGSLTVNAAFVTLSGTSVKGRPSGLFTTTQADGDAGVLTINTKQLLVENGAEVTADTFGAGDAGDLTVKADSVKLSGAAGKITGLLAQVQPKARGNGGNLTIETGQLLVQNGALVSSATLGTGNAGNLTINALESVELSGTRPSLLTALSTKGSGDAGNLRIETGELIVRDGGQVTVLSVGSGNAGELTVEADSIELDKQGAITATTLSGKGGDITLRSQDLLLLRRESKISTRAGTEQTSGTSGNITIDTDNLVALGNSDIDANAFGGPGGQVRIKAPGIFGTQAREEQTSESDITASSNLGPQFSGTVEINTLDVDPSRGLVNLPTVPVDTEVVQACTPGGTAAQSEFIITGRGGLPPNPDEALSTDALQVDLITLNPEVDQSSNPAVSTSPTSSPTPTPIVEATGWAIAPNGNVVLTANAPTVTPHSSWQRTVNCGVS